MNDHVSDEQVRRLTLGELDGLERAEWRNLVHHFLAGCAICSERAEPLLQAILQPDIVAESAPDPEIDAELDSAYDAAIGRALDRFRARAKRQFPFGVPQSEIPLDLTGTGRVEWLLAQSFAARYKNPKEMWRFATFAHLAARSLDESQATPELAADLQARTCAELANACRVNDDFTGAEKAFEEARRHFDRGSHDPSLEARLLELRATYLNDRSLFPQACDLLFRVEQIQREIGDPHLAARAVVLRGIYTLYDENPKAARELLARGLRGLDPERDPELYHSTRQSYIWALVDCGEALRAANELLSSGLREALADSPLNLAKLRWLEGHIYAGLRRRELAEGAFQAAREAFHQHGQAYNASLVGLDLAAVWLEQGRTRDVMDLADEISAIFAQLGVSREVELAIRYVYVACEMNLATAGKIRYVKRFLERAERDPYLAFVYPEQAGR
ncbi:MAG: hypothetical protein ABJC13_07935 [Acidobacteriota bacterium]